MNLLQISWICLQSVGSVVAWGQEPHYMVAYIAAHFLPEDTALHIQNLLDFPLDYSMEGFANQLSSLGMWADSEEASWSKYYHIAHTRAGFPDWDITQDCGYRRNGVCLPTGIANWTSIAADPLQSRSARAESVKFLLHVMADIHQPLHVGLWSDFGGNKITNIYPSFTPGPWGNSYNLHQLWDRGLYLYWKANMYAEEDEDNVAWKELSKVLIKNLRKSPALREQYTVRSSPGDLTRKSVALGLPTRLATETVKLVGTYAYFDENSKRIKPDQHVSEEYILSRVKVMKDQLTKAGLRLAHLLIDIVAKATSGDDLPDLFDATLKISQAKTPMKIVPKKTLMKVLRKVDSDDDDDEEEEETADTPKSSKVTFRKTLVGKADRVFVPPAGTGWTIVPKSENFDMPKRPMTTGIVPREATTSVVSLRPATANIPVARGIVPLRTATETFTRVVVPVARDVVPLRTAIKNIPVVTTVAPVIDPLKCPYCQKKYTYPKCLQTHIGKCPSRPK